MMRLATSAVLLCLATGCRRDTAQAHQAPAESATVHQASSAHPSTSASHPKVDTSLDRAEARARYLKMLGEPKKADATTDLVFEISAFFGVGPSIVDGLMRGLIDAGVPLDDCKKLIQALIDIGTDSGEWLDAYDVIGVQNDVHARGFATLGDLTKLSMVLARPLMLGAIATVLHIDGPDAIKQTEAESRVSARKVTARELDAAILVAVMTRFEEKAVGEAAFKKKSDAG